MRSRQAMDFALTELKERIARWTGGSESYASPATGLSLFQLNCPTDPKTVVSEPSLCLIAQGSKRLLVGDESYVYNTDRYLLTSVHLPTVVCVAEASPEKPYFGIRIRLDQQQLSQLMADSQLPPPRNQQPSRGIATAAVAPPLLSAVLRLVELLDDERDIPILAPTIQKEIIYRLLVGELGTRLRQIATVGSLTNEVSRAIDWIKENYHNTLDVDDLASRARMSRSTFYQHFRSVTAMSPLQYQKLIRLQEARRLMLTEHLDAASAGHRVGYGSPSQFSREYSREFGASPLRDVAGLREAVR